MAASVRSSVLSFSTTVTLPPTIGAGDLIWGFASINAGATIIGLTSGYEVVHQATSGGAVTGAIIKKTDPAVGNEDGGTITLTLSSTQVVRVAMYAVQDAGALFRSNPTTGESDTPSFAAVNPGLGALEFLLFACIAPDSNTDTDVVPSGYGNHDTAAGDGISISVSRRTATVSSETPGNATLEDEEQWVAYTVAISPSGGGNAARSMYYAMQGMR